MYCRFSFFFCSLIYDESYKFFNGSIKCTLVYRPNNVVSRLLLIVAEVTAVVIFVVIFSVLVNSFSLTVVYGNSERLFLRFLKDFYKYIYFCCSCNLHVNLREKNFFLDLLASTNVWLLQNSSKFFFCQDFLKKF